MIFPHDGKFTLMYSKYLYESIDKNDFGMVKKFFLFLEIIV